MQTSPVITQTQLQATPAPAKAPAEPNGKPFDQVLSREMSDRSNAAQAADHAQPDNSASAAASSQGGKTNAADGKQTRKADDKSDDGDSKDTKGKTADSPDAMLALVTGLHPAANTQASDTTAAAGQSAADKTDHIAVLGSTKKTLAAGFDPKATGKDAGEQTDPLATAGDGRKDAIEARAGSARDKNALLAANEAGHGSASADGAQTAAAAKTDFATELKDTLANAAAPQAAQAPQAMQHALLNPQQIAGAATDKLAPPVGTPAWDQALGQKVVWMVGGDQQSASLTLNPPDLGPLQVVLNVHNDTAHASFTAAQPEVRQALEAAMPKLREMLGDAGIQLGQASVNSGSAQQQAFDQQAPRGGDRINAGGGSSDSGTPLRTTRIATGSAGVGLVDTFV